MGEMIFFVSMAKAALALGVRRIVIIPDDASPNAKSQLHSLVNASRAQVVLTDYITTQFLNDGMLADPWVRQRGYMLAFWPAGPKERQSWGVCDDLFAPDRFLLAWNYTNTPPHTPMGLLPTALAVGGTPGRFWKGTWDGPQCWAFFHGKNPSQVEKLKLILPLVEAALSKQPWATEGMLCTGVRKDMNSSIAAGTGLTRNLGVMSPTTFASMMRGAAVVVGSGSPNTGPTMGDALYAGSVYFAPRRQFGTMQSHPLFHYWEDYADDEARARHVVDLIEARRARGDVAQAVGAHEAAYDYNVTLYVENVKGVFARTAREECAAGAPKEVPAP
eukprot:TRINITY_DN2860_c0_g1_i2.p1 TRINITY_DN2860_c0_g1~~TRINITY_DN2860_c0_g1_i2.p1  ORF type:complete len:332 (+),score=48.40 TRINITY_DN2860_c0_g1_i2:527-1522(+)